MNKKTIVMIGNTSWGMFHFRAETMKEFISRGHRVIILAPKDEFSQRFQGLNCEFIEINLSRKGTRIFGELSSICELFSKLKSIKPDVVLSYTVKPVIYGTLASKFSGVKTKIAITTGLGFVFNHDNYTTKVAKLLYKFVLNFADEVWFLNRDDESTFIQANLVKKEKTFVLPGEGVDVKHYSPTQEEKKDITFTLISRMLWDKGIGIFVESARVLKGKYPHVIFQILGPTDEGNPEAIPLKQLEEWNKEGFISYLGSTNDIRPILKNTTCLVHPTYYKEGVPRILMEANAMGIPCITTDIPGCRDVIQHRFNGFLISPKNTDALTDSMNEYLNLSEDSRTNFSQNGRMKIVNEFSSKIINDIYIRRLGL